MKIVDMPLFVEIPNGDKYKPDLIGVVLNTNEGQKSVPINQMNGIELDAEDIDEATLLYMTYEGVDYQFDLPPRDSFDWEIIEEIFDPE
ncbi:MAG: hypothetical protein F6J92_38700 [Symploca sp. SIO1A3]|nr:hypothetical protein [Symploca sp. SIO1A3]